MNKDQIKALISAKIAGQGNQVDSGGALDEILNAIVDAIPEAAEPIVWHGRNSKAKLDGSHTEVHITESGFGNRKIGDFVDFNAVTYVEEKEYQLPVRVMITSTTEEGRASGWGIASDGMHAVQMPCLFGYFEEEEEP